MRSLPLPTFSGHLDKMRTTLEDPVQYFLPLDTLEVPLNEYIGRDIALRFTGKIHCSSCGRSIRKTYSDGHCFPCTRTLASCDFCILKPELCHYHKGTCREPAWGERNCMTDHIVYLANSCGLKVGITKVLNVPTRWIDQGAHEALPIMRVDTRLTSGMMEIMFKEHVSDRTNWRKMLMNEREEIDLPARRDELFTLCAESIEDFRARHPESVELLRDEDVVRISYPARAYPTKVKSFNFQKTPDVEGKLMAIKGQYLILSTGVINIRKFTAYEVEVSL
jgi:hypothetical protein